MEWQNFKSAVIWAAFAAVLFVVLILATGCTKENLLPVTELPKQPLSAKIPCEPLSEAEKSACMKEVQEAKTVCGKVEKNHVVCEDQQDFVRRLYEARDGK